MKAGRWRMAVTVVALAAAVTPAAFSKPTAASTTILIQADFGVGYEVDWTAEENVGTPCSIWRKWRVHNEVNAKSGKHAPSRLYTIAGQISSYQSLPEKFRAKLPPLMWGTYDLVAVGWAHGTIQRTLTETGGVNWTSCIGTKPTYTPTRNDCGGEHPFTVRNASLRAERRVLDGTLFGLRDRVGAGNGRKVIEFNIEPLRSPYRMCEILPDTVTPEFPAKLGLVVPLNTAALLTRLKKPGDFVKFDSQGPYNAQYRGDCVEKKELPNPFLTCKFELDLNVTIRRTH